MMIRLTCSRFFSSSRTCMSVTKSSALGKLRKSTGYSVSNCKKALELFPGDVIKAEEWLHAEAKQKGWAKWLKIQERTATQGLIGVFAQDTVGVMLEVNCETDFVARNAEFQEFVQTMLKGCVNHATNLICDEDINKVTLEESDLSALKSDSTTVGELVASAISKFNEKTVAKRAVCLKIKDDLCLAALSHPNFRCSNLNGAALGKYGVLLAYKKKSGSDENDNEVGLNICQHIIGMNPLSIGKLTEKDLSDITNKKKAPKDMPSSDERIDEKSNEKESDEKSDSIESSDSSEVENQINLGDNLKETNETRLLFQPFLLDSNATVGETLINAGVEVLDYERFECGETNLESTDVSQSEDDKVATHA